MTRLFRSVLLAAIVPMLVPASVSAQIFIARDAGGTTVLSNERLERPTQIFGVQGAPAYRTTTAALPGRAGLYEELVLEHAKRHSLRPELVRAVIQVESGFDPWATSPKGAMGLMQLMPQTARSLGVLNAYDPEENIRGGTLYLRQLLTKYGSEQLALAAYNAGPGAVDRYDGVPPYRETREYVRKVGARAGAAATTPSKPPTVFYRTYEIVGDRIIPKLTQDPPRSGPYEVVG